MYVLYSVYFALFCAIAFVVYLVCGRIIARILELVAKKVFKVEVQINRAHFFALSGIKIEAGGTKIELENITLQTKWSFHGAACFMMLCFGHMTITVARVKNKREKQDGIKNTSNSGNSQNARIINIARMFSKYLGVHFRSLDIALYDQPSPKFNIILQVIKGITILFKPNENFLKYSIKSTKFVSQLHQTDGDFVQEATLAEIAFNILLEGSLDPSKSPNILEKLSVKVNPLQISIGDNFISNVQSLHQTNDVQQLSLTEGENDPNTRYTRLLKYFPKHFDVAFIETDVFVCDQEQRELSIHLDKLICTAAQDESLVPDNSKIFKTMAQLTGLKIKAGGLKNCVSLNKLMVTAKAEKTETLATHVASTVYVESCHCNYIHEELSYWSGFLAFKKQETKSNEKNSFFRTLEKFTKQISFESNMEVIDLSASLLGSSRNGKRQPVCQAVIASFVTDFVFPSGDDIQQNVKTINCSARLENAYVYFNVLKSPQSNLGMLLEDDPSVLPSSRKHIWGRVLELGSFSVKCGIELVDSDSSPRNITMKCGASSLMLEYSQHTKDCLITLLQTGEIDKILKKRSSAQKSNDKPVKTIVECEVTVHDVNVFCVGQCEDGVDSMVARLDVASLTKCKEIVSVGVHGCKLERLRNVKKEAFNCEKSSELRHYMLAIPSIKTTLDSKENKISLPNLIVQWDVTSHMALHDRVLGIMEDSKELQGVSDGALKTIETSSDENTTSYNPVEITAGNVDFKMKTSPECSFHVQFSGVIKLEEGLIMAKSPNVTVSFDEKPIFEFKTFSLKRLHNIAEVTTIRKEVEGFELTKNKTWVLETEVYVLFPYRFDFAKSLDKFLIVNKLLKQLYRKPRSNKTVTEPLYADVWVKLSKVSFEIEDDPFEVKLGKNYELLSDEALQWTEREMLLEEKINEVKRKPGNLLSDKKVEGFYYSLSEKKSKIYIERSVKLYEEDKRTRLCCWEFANVNLMILADESMNGRDRIVPAIENIDKESSCSYDDIEFTTLWCRFIKGTISSSTLTLRDYQQPLFLCESFAVSGNLIGAEQTPTDRARRTCVVEICQPWDNLSVSRGMSPLKYFHDLTFDFNKLEMAWGVDIQPAYAMVTIAFEHINKASVDPSISLPFWDKMRLLLHGRLQMNIKEWQLNWRATRNPSDKSEKLEVEWKDVKFNWTNARFEIFGDFDLFTRTASKYDDCCVLHLPALRFCADLEWHCRDNGDPNNHYNVRPCAPDKLPELPPGQLHDSFAAFRSQNLSLNVSFEVEADKLKDDDMPTILLYATTFRWFQKFQAVVWRNVSRPTKKGSIFNRIFPNRKPLSRHYRNCGFNLKFPQLRLFYWGSFTKNLGAELHLGTGSLNTVYEVGIEEFNDGLIRRPAATWSIIKLDSEIDDVTCYVTGIEDKETGDQQTEEITNKEELLEPTKFYLGHVDRLVYTRNDSNTKKDQSENDRVSSTMENCTHNLVCHNFRAVWTLTNRKLTFGLVETYSRSQQLKRDLSADALKFVKVEKKTDSGLDTSSDSIQGSEPAVGLSSSQTRLDELVSKTIGEKDDGESLTDGSAAFGLSQTRARSITGDVLLDQLLSETASKFFVNTEEGETAERQSSGYVLCNSEDVLEQRWHFEFINSQVMLKGIENPGCVIVTAGIAKVLKRLHRPTQTGRKLLNKMTWVGHLENLQYFCTIRANDDINKNDIPWLDSSVIQSRRKKTVHDLSDLSNLVGSGDSVGGMVGNIAGSSNVQLQRIVSRCGCEFYYANFDGELESVVEGVAATDTPTSSASSNIRGNQSSGEPVNTFTLKHPILEISINSAQYALILDIVSNILLHTEPQKKEVSDLEQRMGFYFQLSTAEDLKGTILNVQNNVRGCVMALNELRRDLYNLNEIMKEKENSCVKEQEEDEMAEIEDLKMEKMHLESEVAEAKANLSELSTELRIMISAYKDFQTNRVLLSPEKARGEELMKVVEVYLDHVTWRLIQPDGQLQIVDANLTNLSFRRELKRIWCWFVGCLVVSAECTLIWKLRKTRAPNETTPNYLQLFSKTNRDALWRRYTNIMMTNSSGAHSVEVGDFNMTNLLPNSPYKKVITPRGERRVGKDVAVRVYCRVKSPVGGIGVKEHFEVNLCPLDVGLTYKLYTLMMGYFFPGRAHEYVSESGDVDLGFGVVDSQGQKEVFHEQEPTTSHKLMRPTTLSISDTTLNDTPRSRLSTTSLDSPTLSLPSPLGTDKKPGRSRFYASLSETASKELDKMKERASQTNNFVYVKIPEIPMCFSYKGEKEKNLVDVHNFRLNLPTLHYQNRTWTWLDLMMTVKKDYKQVLVGQLIKEKLHWKGGENKEEKVAEINKAKILFGDKQGGTRKKKRRSLFTKLGLKSKSDKSDAVDFGPKTVKVETSYEGFDNKEDEDNIEGQSRSSDEGELSGEMR